MGLVAFGVLGFLVGLAVTAMMSGEEPSGVVFGAVAGMFGGLAGGVLVAWLVGVDPLAQFWNLATWGGAVVGAIVVLAVYVLISEQGGA